MGKYFGYILFLILLYSPIILKSQECSTLITFKNGKKLDLESFTDSLIAKDSHLNESEIDYAIKKELRKSLKKDYSKDLILSFEPDEKLNSAQKSIAAFSDLIILGRVISKNRAEPTTKCLLFKTSYEILVKEVLFSVNDVCESDTIELRSLAGIAGESCIVGGDYYSVSISGYKDYKLNDIYLLFLSNSTYFAAAYHSQKIAHERTYFDPLCIDIYSDNTSQKHADKLELAPHIKSFLAQFYNL